MQQPIRLPAGYTPVKAIAFAGIDGDATLVSAVAPLPVVLAIPDAADPLIGSSDTAMVAGPFIPQLGRAIWLTLSGSWSGTAQLLRSADGGATKPAVTLGGEVAYRYAANVNEPVAQETVADARWYLQLTPTSGTIDYRVQQ